MLAVVDRALAQGSRAQEDERSGQSSLFGGAPGGDAGEESERDREALPDIPEFPPNVLLGKEKEVLGFFVSASPLAEYADLLRRYSKTTTAGLAEKGDGSPVVIGGLVTGRRERLTKQGKKMAVIVLQDFEGTTECVAFEEALKGADEQLKEDRVVFIVGEVSRKWEQPSVRINQVYAASETIEKMTADIHISLREQALEDETLTALRDLLKSRPGKTPVHIELTTSAGAHAVIKVGDTLHVGPDAALVADIDNLLGEGHLILVGGSGPVVPVKKRWNGNGQKNGNGYGRLK
jgi:DNA polymerase-3 subunit alpha